MRSLVRAATVAAATLTLLALAATAHASTVTVKDRDTLWTIAARQCGNPNLWPAIWRDNPQIANPHWIYPGQHLTINCTTAPRTTAAASRSTTRTGTANTGGWSHPLPGTVCVSGWGAPRAGHTHKGIDLPARTGTPIRAAHAGVVQLVRYQADGAGHYVVLAHGGGTFTVYMHLRSRTFLRVGAHVTAGQTIGYVGETGDASGPHLHFEVHLGLWHPVNPAPWLRSHGVRVGC